MHRRRASRDRCSSRRCTNTPCCEARRVSVESQMAYLVHTCLVQLSRFTLLEHDLRNLMSTAIVCRMLIRYFGVSLIVGRFSAFFSISLVVERHHRCSGLTVAVLVAVWRLYSLIVGRRRDSRERSSAFISALWMRPIAAFWSSTTSYSLVTSAVPPSRCLTTSVNGGREGWIDCGCSGVIGREMNKC